MLFFLELDNANGLCPGLLPPGPPSFIFSFIPACLFGVGLKGVGWTRTENDISTRTSSPSQSVRTTQSRAIRERGHMAAALTCLPRDPLAKFRIAMWFSRWLQCRFASCVLRAAWGNRCLGLNQEIRIHRRSQDPSYPWPEAKVAEGQGQSSSITNQGCRLS